MARRRIVRILVGLAAPTLLAVVIALVLMQWHKATRVELVLTVDRAAFTVAPSVTDEAAVTLLDAGRMSAVRVDRIARVAFEADSLEAADEHLFDLKKNRFPHAAWQPLANTGEAVLEPVHGAAGADSAVTLKPVDGDGAGVIKSVRSDAGVEVVMELGTEDGGKRVWLNLALDTTAADIDLVFPARFLLFADYMGFAGTADRAEAPDSLSLRAGSDTNTLVHIQGSARGLALQLEPLGSGTARLAEGGIPVSAVDFTRQGPSGERRSSLVGPGSLSYPDLPTKAPMTLAAGEFVSLEGLHKARIEALDISRQDGRGGLKLTLDALASRVRIGTPEQPRDARLTWLDVLWHSPVLGSFFAIMVWLFPTTLAGYKLWKELRSSSESS